MTDQDNFNASAKPSIENSTTFKTGEPLNKDSLLRLLEEDEDVRKLLQKLFGQWRGEDAGGEEKGKEKIQRLKSERDALQEKVHDLQHEFSKLQKEHVGLQGRCQRAESEAQRLRQEDSALQEKLHTQGQTLQQLQRENASLQQRPLMPAQWQQLLEQIRADGVLLQRFSLPQNDDDLSFLLTTVAVFSQKDNLTRLWKLLDERCKERSGPWTEAEAQIFGQSLDWHNANWPDKPYELLKPEPGMHYDSGKHQRPPGMLGDRIRAVWLPGIPELKLKPLVATD